MGWIEVPAQWRDEAQQANTRLEQVLQDAPSVHTIDIAATRSQRSSGEGLFGPLVKLENAHSRAVVTPAGLVGLRCISPSHPEGVYLHMHGGGWVLGAADQQDLLLQRIAYQANVAVVSVEYRLAPEHPFPAAVDDCEAAATWLIAQAKAEWGTERLLIGGESAGAHLAALTLLRIRDRISSTPPFLGANLVFGVYDLGMSPSQRLWGNRNLVLSTSILNWFYDCFVPQRSPEQRRDPLISPLYASLNNLPPALFVVGAHDPLLDDSTFMAARWASAGNEGTLAVYSEGIHAFTSLPTHLADQALDQQIRFIRNMVKSQG